MGGLATARLFSFQVSCEFFQEFNLSPCFDRYWFDCPNATNRIFSALTLGNQIHGNHCTSPAKTGLTMNRHRTLAGVLLCNEVDKVMRLLQGWRAAVRDRQTEE